MAFTVLGNWIRGLVSILLLVGAGLLLREWVDRLPREERVAATARPGDPGASDLAPASVRTLRSLPERIEAWWRDPERSTAPLVWGGLLLLLAVGGRGVSPRLWRRREAAPVTPPARVQRIERRDGRALHVEEYGPEDAPPVVLVHGLGSDRTQWLEAVEDLVPSYRVIVYDLLGHGDSARPPEADYSLPAMAGDLNAVLKLAGVDPAVVVGHSMGGMIALTWCRQHRETRRERLAGLVLVHTTPHNPFETMAPVPWHERLRKPLHEPLLRLTTVLSPVVRVMNLLSYWNGSTHWSNDMQFFGGHETREQLDRTARVSARMSPGVQARCALALTAYEAGDLLPDIDIPAVVVTADRDPITVPEAGDSMAEAMPHAHLVTLERARHMGFMEWREHFAEAVHGLERTLESETRQARRRASSSSGRGRSIRAVPTRK